MFNYYDTDGSGSLDYKEFTVIITDNDKGGRVEKKNQQFGQGFGYKAQVQAPAGTNTNEILAKVRAKLASRGARGLIGMGKQFKIFDDNNSRSLD